MRGLGLSVGLIAAVVGLSLAAGAQAAPGELDPSFSGDGIQLTDFGGEDAAGDVALQGDGKIVAVGHDGASRFAVARYSTNGSLDPTFSGDGKRTLGFGGDSDATGVAIQPDGKIVVAGYARPAQLGGTWRFAIARLNPDGTLDRGFSGDGKRTTGFRDGAGGEGLALQADGKVVVVGWAGVGSFNGGCCDKFSFALARYNADGTFDGTFSGDGRQMTRFGKNWSVASGVALQGRKIVVAGSGLARSDFAIARYRADGSLDPRFAGDGKQTTNFGALDHASDVILQDGRLVAGGSTVHPNGGAAAIARYNLNGTLDASFADDGKQLGGPVEADALAAAPGGKFVVVGPGGAVGADFAIARYTSDGALDTSFANDGWETTIVGRPEHDGGAHGVVLQPDGKIVAAGTGRGPSATDDFALVRYLGG